ncbi:MAG: hypothetical protein ABI551_25335, partial [Polyangiaceae bacterium]
LRGPLNQMTLAAAQPVARSIGISPTAPGAPSPRLPAEHFAAALGFFTCGAVGLVWVAGDLANGLFYLPRVAAVVHLFTLGWIVLSIMGALCQFLPVAVGRGLRWPRAAHVSFAAQTLGVALFVGALASGRRELLHVGACLLSIGFVLFATNLAATLAKVSERNVTWWALAGASVFFVVTPAYGVVLALSLNDGSLGAHRFEVVAAHAHIALVGIVLLVIVGVAHRLLPMFLLSHGASERPAWVAVVCLFFAAAILAVPIGGAVRVLVAWGIATTGVLGFVVQAALFFHHRKRRALDPGMRLAAVAIAGIALATVMAPFALAHGLRDLHLLVAYFVVLLGAISLFVAAHYFKIVPFLVWHHRFGALVGTRKVPKVADLFSERAALVTGALLIGGWSGLALASYLGVEALARFAAVGFAAGALLETTIIARVALRRFA